MPLPVTEDREHIHTRTIAINAYRRGDGQMDVEGRITDVKPFDHRMMDGFRKKGDPVHDLSIRITLDDEMNVTDAVASMDQAPTAFARALRQTSRTSSDCRSVLAGTKRSRLPCRRVWAAHTSSRCWHKWPRAQCRQTGPAGQERSTTCRCPRSARCSPAC